MLPALPCKNSSVARALSAGTNQPCSVTPSSVLKLTSSYASPICAGVATSVRPGTPGRCTSRDWLKNISAARPT
jgi:hypothetical protein